MGQLVARLDAIYCVSDYSRQRLVDRCPGVEAEIIHTGVDTAYFDPGTSADERATDTPELIYFGRIVTWKGLKYFVAALKQLWDQPWHATIVGDGPQKPELESLIASVGLGDRIKFLPAQPRDRIRTLIGESDIAVFPSIAGETFSNALLEAMSMARAVISTRVGGFQEAVTHGEDGMLVNPRDSSGLAAALSDLLGNPGKREILGEKARATVRARFESSASFAQVERLLWSLL